MKDTDKQLNSIRDFYDQALVYFQIQQTSTVIGDWINRKEVMKFFDYGDTQMRELENSGEIIVSQVGRRKFIAKSSITKYLDKNIKTELK